MQELAVDYEGVAVVVLLFESSLAPFVVRNAVFGKPEGGAVAWEVPWREGTTVRSATRPQLLKLLLPLRSLPGLEVMSATCHLYPQGNERISWQVGITMYATVPMGSGVVIPQHRAHASLAIPAAAYVCELEPTLAAKQWSGGGGFATVQADERVHTVHSGDSQVIIDGPGFLRLFGSAEVDMPPTGSDNLFEELEVRASLRPVGSDDDALISVSLHPDAREPDEGRHPPALIRWKSREAPR
jgi:hypothetical protein